MVNPTAVKVTHPNPSNVTSFSICVYDGVRLIIEVPVPKPAANADLSFTLPLAAVLTALGPPDRNKALLLGVAAVNIVGKGPNTMGVETFSSGPIQTIPEAVGSIVLVQ